MTNDRFIFPINLRNVHWAAGMVDLKSKRITIYDSMPSKDKHAMLRKKLLRVLCCLQHASDVTLAPSILNMKQPP